MAPKKFGKYEVLARLATGGAANIFLARQPGAAGFHKLVCLKTLLPERASDADFVAMFLDEARLAARLNHPNCVQIYDLGRVRGSYYISMEYIFGETLWNLLATVTKLRTPLPAQHVAAIVGSVCDGLHHAHELKDSNGRPYNLVHRDVSPQNIMVSFEGQTKVVDFGIAKAETGRAPTIAGIVKGKFSYMSPEQITGGSIDRRSDVYSLGIVLFECLASRRLYRGDSPEDIARLILEHRAPRLKDVVPDIPPQLDTICATALARHPTKRYQTAHQMGDALRDFLDSVRYNHSAAAIAKLVEERFKGAIAERRKVYESALAGSYDEKHLLEVLDARAARDIDLFPEDDTGAADEAGDFVEHSQVALDVSEAVSAACGSGMSNEAMIADTVARSSDGTEDAERPDADDSDDAATGDLGGVDTGLNDALPDPEVQSSPWEEREESGDDVQAPVSVLTDSEWSQGDDADDGASQNYDDRTRVDADDVAPADTASFDSKDSDTRVDLDDFGDETESPRVPIDGPTSVEMIAEAHSAEPLPREPYSGILMSGGDSFVGEATYEQHVVHEEKTFLDATDQLEADTGEFAAETRDAKIVNVNTSPTRPQSMRTSPSGISVPPSETAPSQKPPQARSASVASLRGGSVSVGAASGRSGPMITRSPGQSGGDVWQGPTAQNDVLQSASGASAPAAAAVRLEQSTISPRKDDQDEAADALDRAQSSTDPSFGGLVNGSQLIRRATSEMMKRDDASFDPDGGTQLTPLSPSGRGSATPPVNHEAIPAAATETGRRLDGKFGLAVVIAALGIGVFLGIAIGVLIAKAAYSPVSIPIEEHQPR